jgi:hypothetical protein
MARIRLGAWLAVVVVTGGLLAACGHGVNPKTALKGTSAADVFYAISARDGYSVDAFRTVDGSSVARVAAGSLDGLRAVSVRSAGPGRLMLTYGGGPACTSGVAGCGPKPGTCGGRVEVLDLSTAKRTVVWSVSADQLLLDATPNADGSRVAALIAPCAHSYENEHLIVKTLSDGRTVEMGTGLARCHSLSAPTWLSSGQVLVSYGPSTDVHPYAGPEGTCNLSADPSLVSIDPRVSQPGFTGETAAAPAGCLDGAPAADGASEFVAQMCGSAQQQRVDGSVKLLQLNAALAVVGVTPLPRCSTVDDLAVAQGRVLLNLNPFCPKPTPQIGGLYLQQPPAAPRAINSTPAGLDYYESLAW